ncbi:cell division protein FtsL [Macrococcoides caseolyticum]|uniref:cell division protein FtsL n=1 Tax=Macrococcoides caseolyticum TaxID=69966 RepID=UPI00339D8A5A
MAVEYINPNYYNQINEQVKVKSVPKTHVVSLSKLEKLIYLTLVSLIAFVSIYMLSLKYDAYQTNTQIAAIEGKIVHQQSVNGELNSEVMKQSSYERVYSKAKSYGLSLKNDNVKVVQKDVTK